MLSRTFIDRATTKILMLLTIFFVFLFIFMVFGLCQKSAVIIGSKHLSELLFGKHWHPLKGEFGFYPFISGTLWVTFVAMVIAIPLGLFTSIYLAEYAHKTIRTVIKPLVHQLAGIPSVVYGIWGVLVVVPFIRDFLAPRFGAYSSGYCLLAAGIVLAIMVFPVIISIAEEVLRSVSLDLKEASLSLGATHWQTVKYVVIRKARPGIIAAIILGFARALGETMAVLMVAGNVAVAPKSIFEPAYTLPALIANNYGEMMSIPLYDSALMLAALLLLIVVAFFSIISRMLLLTTTKTKQR